MFIVSRARFVCDSVLRRRLFYYTKNHGVKSITNSDFVDTSAAVMLICRRNNAAAKPFSLGVFLRVIVIIKLFNAHITH